MKDLESILDSDISEGLSAAKAEMRLKECGENKLAKSKALTFWDILKEEVTEPLIILLLFIGVIYSIWGKIGDTITIIFVILTVSLVEVYTEYKAKKSIESLKKLALPTTWVLRDNKPSDIETSRIVPGDLLILQSGVKIGADARIAEASGLEADESQLTGESMGVAKIAAVISEDTGLNDRKNMVHMGSVILKGKGTALVINTGMDTELGKIAGLTQEAREAKTPLQKSMKQLSKNLIWIAVTFSILIPVLGVIRGLPPKEMILTGLSLSFATIPEEMPIIVTMLLGLGAINLSKKNVLIRRTRAAETLGSVTVIATDKTGTLTENSMSIRNWEAKDEQLLFTIGALMAAVAYDNDGSFLGDPMDKAVLDRAKEFNIDRSLLLEKYALKEEMGFDDDKKIFAAEYQHEGKTILAIKGAPESIFTLSTQDAVMEAKLKELMKIGYRTIALAYKENEEKYFTVAGLISFDDPIREGVKEAVEACTSAGVKVVMITGDHASTAERVADNAGIKVTGVLTGEEISKLDPERLKDVVKKFNVFARISPEQKFQIVTVLRENGEVIAVTGDGINDSPALKAADIGISMGISGTDVAKEAADMILTNDSFTSIIGAIKEGRKLFDNLSKCVKYYLACKVGLIITFVVPVLFNMPLPFSPIQIIILELFMDLAASTSFVAEPAESDVLKRKPRDPKENFMNKNMIMGIFSGGITLSAAVLIVYFYSWTTTSDLATVQTYAFVIWLFSHVCLAFNMRTNSVPLTEAGFFSSKLFNIWAVGIIVFLLIALNVPGIHSYLKLAVVGIVPVLFLAVFAVIAVSWMEIAKHLKKRDVKYRGEIEDRSYKIIQ
ncbi:MAG TPA: cation-transporting P-type ATPase [Desulfitobacteriaceae bacterium]|nr:cation-transporting P-type ATPase [Desulfitobacteriaceae bacterium]